jgi:hypothetical protein
MFVTSLNRFYFVITGIASLAVSTALAGESERVTMVASNIRLTDASGQVVAPLMNRGQKATVLYFLATECPLGNSYAPEIARIVSDYEKQGVLSYAIYAEAKAPEITRHLADYKLPLTGLQDPKLELATLTGATVTPEVCVFDSKGDLLYRGRIDDRAVKLGTVRVEPRQRDLRLALDAILAHQPVAEKFTKAIGCYLPLPPIK